MGIYNILDFGDIPKSKGTESFHRLSVSTAPLPAVAKHVLIECQEYKEERKNFELEMIKRIENKEWEEIKQSEDKGMKEILGLGDSGQLGCHLNVYCVCVSVCVCM